MKHEKTTCAYCGEEIDKEKAVSAAGNKVVRFACSWRHLNKYLIETYTTGRQFEEGLEKLGGK